MVIATTVIVTGVCAIVSTKSEAPAKTRHPMTSGYGYRRVLLEPSPGNQRPESLISPGIAA
jgi:hypothetical protein